MNTGIRRLVLMGAGHVATHLGLAMRHAGLEVLQVYNRTAHRGKELAGKLGCAQTTQMQSLLPGADLYLMAVSDDAIPGLVRAFPFRDRLLAHTSGSVPLHALMDAGSRAAAFYPLQTFSTGHAVDWNGLPLCLEANEADDMRRLRDLALALGASPYEIHSDDRKALHLAAVFACNFSNHMFAIAAEILKEKDLPFELIRPLIAETAHKALESGRPSRVQTGPAVRSNRAVMNAHADMLREHPLWKKLYTSLSDSIAQTATVRNKPKTYDKL